MASFRSPETIKKEHDLQVEYTAYINQRLDGTEHPAYRESLKDAETFANVLRKQVPDPTLVILHDRPDIVLIAETEQYKVSIFINGRCWRFKVNGSVHYTLEHTQKLGPSRMLKKIWDVVIENLPENFIVKGVVDSDGSDEEREARTVVLEGLGFGPPQDLNHVYGITRDKKLCPLTLEEFNSLTQIPTEELNQKFNLRQITWPGA
jgi:hypothetical protein